MVSDIFPPPPALAVSGEELLWIEVCGVVGVGGRLHSETAQSALTVFFKLIISGLTSVSSVVLGTVTLQFQLP